MAYQPEVEKLEKQYQTNPDQYFAPLADAYRKAGNLDFALDIVRNGLAKRPNYLSAHIVLGRCLLDQKNDPEAAKVFEQVLVLDAENIIALRYLGEISERSGDGSGAQRWLRRLLDVDPMNDDAVDALKRLEAEAPAAPPVPLVVEQTVAEPEPPPAEEPAPAGFETTTMDAPESVGVAREPVPVPSDGAANDFGIEQSSSPFETPGAVTPDISALGLEPTEMTFGEDGQPGAGGGAKLELSQPEPETVADFDAPPQSHFEEPPPPEAPTSFEPPMLAFEAPPPEPEPEPEPVAAVVEEPEPEPQPPTPEPWQARKSGPKFGPTSDLPLIMPDDMDPEPVGSSSEGIEPEPVITETMAEVYVKQGLLAEAKEVYRKLVQRRPGDSALREKLAKLEQQKTAPARSMPSAPQQPGKPRFAAVDTGGVSARSFFGRVLSSRPGAPSAGPAAPTSTSAMDAAFAADSGPTPGAPTRPTSDELSLAAVFGEDPMPTPNPPPAPKPSPAAPQPAAPGAPGFSFDEFFGNKPGANAPPPPAESGSEGDGSSPDDFVSWLKGLKS